MTPEPHSPDLGTLSVFDRHNRKVKLREEHLLPASDHCHLCFNPNIRVVGSLQKCPDVDLIECRACRVVSASRLPREEVLERYYADYYSGEVWTTGYPEALARHIFARIGASFLVQDRKLSILDFGGGDGSIAVLLGQRFLKAGNAGGVDVTLVDYNAKKVGGLPSGIVLHCHRRLEELPAERRFDLVVASAILEHIPQANRLLTALLLRLDEQGYFYARTPFMIAVHKLFARLGVRSPIPYPGHLHDMGRDYWDRVVRILKLDQDFRLVASNTGSVETDVFSRRWWVALLSHLLKAPSHVSFLRDRYDFVGGWEAFIQRVPHSRPVDESLRSRGGRPRWDNK